MDVVSFHFLLILKDFGSIMVCVLSSRVVDLGLDLWSDKSKDYKIDADCISAKHKEF
jgi:hypothetical protein